MAVILVVDDEKPVRNLLVKFFQDAGYEVEEAGSGATAIEAAKNKRFDLFIIDINLPGITGLDLCRQLKSNHPGSVFIAITGYVSAFDFIRCREAGFDDYFAKPFDMTTLNDTVEHYIKMLQRWRTGK